MQKENLISSLGLWLGIASVFLFEFSIVPMLAIIFSVIGIYNGIKSGKQNWQAWAGLLLGIVYLVVRISMGNIDR